MKKLLAVASVALLALPCVAGAHEVYVLSKEQIQEGLTAPAFSWSSTVLADLHSFLLWALIGAFVVALVFGISIVRPLEKALMPTLDRVKRYAPHVSRITIGIAFLASAYFGAAYGPELPFVDDWGAYAPFVAGVFVLVGACLITGVFARGAALIALVIFGANILFHGSYMLTYTNYFGEMLVLLLVGAHSLNRPHTHQYRFGKLEEAIVRIGHRLQPYAFLILRVTFGFSLFYASFYAKFLHDDLAYLVASLPLAGHITSLASVFGLEPHFLVVGAGIVEMVIALFFILGIEIRFTALFTLFWLTLSLFYFGESVWPHIILIGIPIAFIFYGYDKYSLEGMLFKKRKMEPVL